jgi:hypothetical protein
MEVVGYMERAIERHILSELNEKLGIYGLSV